MTDAELAAIVHAVIRHHFDTAMPDWWPPTETWAEEIVGALRAAGAFGSLDLIEGKINVRDIKPFGTDPRNPN